MESTAVKPKNPFKNHKTITKGLLKIYRKYKKHIVELRGDDGWESYTSTFSRSVSGDIAIWQGDTFNISYEAPAWYLYSMSIGEVINPEIKDAIKKECREFLSQFCGTFQHEGRLVNIYN